MHSYQTEVTEGIKRSRASKGMPVLDLDLLFSAAIAVTWVSSRRQWLTL